MTRFSRRPLSKKPWRWVRLSLALPLLLGVLGAVSAVKTAYGVLVPDAAETRLVTLAGPASSPSVDSQEAAPEEATDSEDSRDPRSPDGSESPGSGPSQPTPSQPTPSQPTPSQPTPAQPTPAQPTPAHRPGAAAGAPAGSDRSAVEALLSLPTERWWSFLPVALPGSGQLQEPRVRARVPRLAPSLGPRRRPAAVTPSAPRGPPGAV